jgi:nanoRNase/pAp phosphatase (c-di-AMP/oligoRNAs hydrolase)
VRCGLNEINIELCGDKLSRRKVKIDHHETKDRLEYETVCDYPFRNCSSMGRP